MTYSHTSKKRIRQGVRMSLGTSLMKHESESGQTVLEKVNDDDSDAGEILTQVKS